VLGIADVACESLRPELRAALTEYHRVDDLDSIDALLRAVGHFTHRHGKIYRLESLNEHWLATDAPARRVQHPGLRAETIDRVKRYIMREPRLDPLLGAAHDILAQA
jgi:hypothetical protein